MMKFAAIVYKFAAEDIFCDESRYGWCVRLTEFYVRESEQAR